MTEYSTRRERRQAEQEAFGTQLVQFDVPYSSEFTSPGSGTRRALRQLERNPPVKFVEGDSSPKTSEIVLPEIVGTPEFSINLGTDSHPKTGSIQLPILSSDTGELVVVKAARQADEAQALLAGEGFISNVDPVPARTWMAPVDSLKLIPQARNSVLRQMNLAITWAVILVGVGGLVLAAYMLGILS